jgi:ferredoxin
MTDGETGTGRSQPADADADPAPETYELEFVEEGVTIDCGADEYVLDAAMDAGIDIQYGCLEGLCSICGAKVEGEVDQSEGVMLTPDEERAGYVLTCIAYPRSDLRIRTNRVP